MLRKSIIIAHKSIDYIVLIAALLLFLICLYAMIDAYMVYAGANDSNIMKYKPAAGDTEMLRDEELYSQGVRELKSCGITPVDFSRITIRKP